MGADKALVCWHGIPLLKRVCHVALQCCDPVYVLTPWPERYQEVIPHACCILKESNPGKGPLFALLEGFSRLQTTWILLLACDLPLLQADILKIWSTLLKNSQTLAVVPYQENQWEPLCGFYHHHSGPFLQSFLEHGGQSFQHWLSTLPTQKIALDAPAQAMLWNCNSPNDLIPPEV